ERICVMFNIFDMFTSKTRKRRPLTRRKLTVICPEAMEPRLMLYVSAVNDTVGNIVHDRTFNSTTSLLANDYGTGLTASLVSGPTYGTVTVNSNGSYTVVTTSHTGSFSFVYQATDGVGTSNATASFNVTDQAPSFSTN